MAIFLFPLYFFFVQTKTLLLSFRNFFLYISQNIFKFYHITFSRWKTFMCISYAYIDCMCVCVCSRCSLNFIGYRHSVNKQYFPHIWCIKIRRTKLSENGNVFFPLLFFLVGVIDAAIYCDAPVLWNWITANWIFLALRIIYFYSKKSFLFAKSLMAHSYIISTL